MKIIYDNIVFSLQKAGGISIYWSELIKRLKFNDDVMFYEYENENIFRQSLDKLVDSELAFIKRFVRYFPFSRKIQSNAIFHSSYYRVSLQKSVANITTVHDFTYEYYSKGIAKKIHSLQKGFAIKNSDGIICVSENTKKDLIKFYPNINEENIRVIYNGISTDFYKIEENVETLSGTFELLKKNKYILFVGDRSAYKNFNVVLDVISKLSNYQLVIVGGKELNINEAQSLKRANLSYFHFKGISSKDLNVLYNNAFCLLYPSSYEGFGIPIAESMKAGCPVITSNCSSIPEVAGKGALLIDDITSDKVISSIRRLEDLDLREQLVNEGYIQANKFNWDKCFKETYDFYEFVWEKKFK